MKPPKNFYSNLDRRKQDLPEVPEASAADAGKVIKVGSDGEYELGNVPGNESIYILYPSAVANNYDYPSGITGETIYNEFVSGKNIQLRIVHNTIGTVIVRPARYNNNAILFTGLIYDANSSASGFTAIRCAVDNLNSETMTRPWFVAI